MWWLQYPENHHSVCPYLKGDKSFPLVLLCGCAVHPLHHWVFNEDRYSPKDKRCEEVQVNIIPRAMQMSVKRKNQSWSTTYVKAATPHTDWGSKQWALLEVSWYQRKYRNLRMDVEISNCLWEEISTKKKRLKISALSVNVWGKEGDQSIRKIIF